MIYPTTDELDQLKGILWTNGYYTMAIRIFRPELRNEKYRDQLTYNSLHEYLCLHIEEDIVEEFFNQCGMPKPKD